MSLSAKGIRGTAGLFAEIILIIISRRMRMGMELDMEIIIQKRWKHQDVRVIKPCHNDHPRINKRPLDLDLCSDARRKASKKHAGQE